MEKDRERLTGIIASIIDPEAFQLLFIGDKPILERTLIRERQIVAEYRAGRVIDELTREFPKALAILLQDDRIMKEPMPP